jgi:hypothetical protein
MYCGRIIAGEIDASEWKGGIRFDVGSQVGGFLEEGSEAGVFICFTETVDSEVDWLVSRLRKIRQLVRMTID